MVLTLRPELETALREAAGRRGVSPEELANAILRERLEPTAPIEPRDEWEKRLLAVASDCGVSLSNEALGRENLYD